MWIKKYLQCLCVSLGYHSSLWLPRDSTALNRSSSYTRRRWDDDLKNNEGSASTNRTSSYQRRLASANRSPSSDHLTSAPWDPMRSSATRSTRIVSQPQSLYLTRWQLGMEHLLYVWFGSPSDVCRHMLEQLGSY